MARSSSARTVAGAFPGLVAGSGGRRLRDPSPDNEDVERGLLPTWCCVLCGWCVVRVTPQQIINPALTSEQKFLFSKERISAPSSEPHREETTTHHHHPLTHTHIYHTYRSTCIHTYNFFHTHTHTTGWPRGKLDALIQTLRCLLVARENEDPARASGPTPVEVGRGWEQAQE